MPEFKDIQQNIQTLRRQRQAADLALFQARERLKRIEALRRRLDRHFDPQNERHRAEAQQLARQREKTESEIAQWQSTLADLVGSEQGQLEAFFPFTDPRENVRQFDDRFPFLLFPLRLETRFKDVSVAGGNVRRQLWVRIYPDDALIDSFEETLSEAEIVNARAYWVNWWKAGGVEAQERAAWRSLVASHGSGRAYYVQENYRPVTPVAERPAKGAEHDLILVVAADAAVPAAEQAPIAAYWTAVWLAAGDGDLLSTAYATLEGALGEARAAEVVATLAPANLSYIPPAPTTPADVAVQVAFLQFPDPAQVDSKQQAWARAPRVNLLPDRFVLLGYRGETLELERIGNPVPSPLIVGPDPQADEAEQMKVVDGELHVPEPMRWMVDFEEALRVGMGFRVDLTPEQGRAGFDRLLVVGLRLSADETEGKTHLETLFQHHQHSKKGFGLLAQGTPTNNTEQMPAGLSRLDDPDISFDNYFLKGDLITPTDDFLTRQDGQWLAEYLGVDLATFQKTYLADGRDQCEARAMNTALWPATFGYFMKSMMPPVFPEANIERTRTFFQNFVLGRGVPPLVRVGQQPYGILPAAAFSRLSWMRRRLPPTTGPGGPVTPLTYLNGLYEVLRRIDADWATLQNQAAYVGKPGDAHQTLLDVLGLHPASVEFYQRYAESFQQLYNRLNLQGLGGAFLGLLIAAGYVNSGMDLLRKLGYDDSQQTDGTPDILEKFFLTKQNLLKRDLIDDQPLSETAGIRAYTTDEKNYLYWLIQAAGASHDTLRKQEGFKDGRIPTALLYLMLHYALDQSFFQTSLDLHLQAEILSGEQARRLQRESDFLYVDPESTLSGESKWSYLYKAEPRITDNPDLLIGDYIASIVAEHPLTRQLREQLTAIEHLKDSPTARLERAFVEHLDTCTYRLDAWKQGLLHYQMTLMRRSPNNEGPGKGVYLGAFGWLEEVRPENKRLTPVELPEELREIFQGDSPLVRDSTNAGYIHAPSINHAVTAAVLRNGYLSNATPANPGTLAVNLSSERVRVALSFIEGIRNGQSLAALLGYQLERALHDRYTLFLDQFIYDLRQAFPLYANRARTTRVLNAPIRQIEARNVVNGLDLIDHIKKTGQSTYPFGKDLPTGEITPAQRQAIEQEVEKLMDIHDAIADLALAEGVHQVVQNNYDRAAATLDTYSKGNFPPLPEVIQTPRGGTSLTHRVGLHLEAGLSPALYPDISPRAKGEPAVNKWLAGILPAPDRMMCRVTYVDHVAGAEAARTVTQADLALEPIDLLFMLRMGDEQAMTALDDLITHYIHATFSPRPDARLTIEYMGPATQPDDVPFFELAPLTDSLRAVVLQSRPLRPGDVLLPSEATESVEQQVTLERDRVSAVESLLVDLTDNELTPLSAGIEALVDVPDPAVNLEAILTNLDGWLAAFADAAALAVRFGLPQATLGDLYERRRALYTALLTKVQDTIDRWDDQLGEYDGLIAGFEALPAEATDGERFALLQRAERQVSAEAVLPATGDSPADFRANVLDGKRAAFVAKKTALEAVAGAPAPTLKGLRDAIAAELPLSDFDLTGLTIADQEHQMLLFAADLLARLRALAAEAAGRLTQAAGHLAAHDASGTATEQVDFLQAAGRALLGDDFLMVPSFRLPAERTEEWKKTWDDRTALLSYQQTQLGIDFPADEWLYGVARVREKMHHWENITVLVEAFDPDGLRDASLTPLQLPYRAGDRWLGLQYKTEGDDFDAGTERLLYTAHYPIAFNEAADQCGLLLDEWTEVIPTREETTGITFHYDRPNAEPPQVMMLVLPTDFRGSWQWTDIVDALHETLDTAKKRAVEPAHVDATAYARFLPATISAVTIFPITIALNYAFNNEIYTVLAES